MALVRLSRPLIEEMHAAAEAAQETISQCLKLMRDTGTSHHAHEARWAQGWPWTAPAPAGEDGLQ
jgi:hypothetical protein